MNGELLITDVSGAIIRRVALNQKEGDLNLDLSDANVGMLLFSISQNNGNRLVTKGIKVK